MNCCHKNNDDSGPYTAGKKCNVDENQGVCYDWYPDVKKEKNMTYIRRLEKQYEALQSCYFDLSTEMARLQFCIRQIIEASPKDRNRLINDLERKVFKDVESISQEAFPTLAQHDIEMGDLRRKQHHLIESLRKQIGSLEKASESLSTEQQEQIFTNNGKTGKDKNSTAKQASKANLRQDAGLDAHFAIKSSSSIGTCNSSAQSIISVRSASFKELQEIYKKGITS